MNPDWAKHIVTWWEAGTLNISVVFSWQLAEAVKYAESKRSEGYHVKIGGPAAKYAGIQKSELPTLFRHHPSATFTSRGCIRKCEFCAVPKIEGDLRELEEWEPKPIVCDNNLLACSRKHFDMVIDRLKTIKGVDFNQGLDCRLITGYHVDRLGELWLPQIRFSWDFMEEESMVLSAIERMLKAGFPRKRIHIYVLFGFKDSPEDALYRFERIKKLGIKPNPMRYQPLDTPLKYSYVAPNWTDHELKRMMRYWGRQNWLSKIPYKEYVYKQRGFDE